MRIIILLELALLLIFQGFAMAQSAGNVDGNLNAQNAPNSPKLPLEDKQGNLSENGLDDKLRRLLQGKEYRKAIPYYEKQLQSKQELYGKSSLQTINCIYEFAQNLRKAGEMTRATQLESEAASLQSSLIQEGDPDPKSGFGVLGVGDFPNSHRDVGDISKYRKRIISILTEKWHPGRELPLTVQLILDKKGTLLNTGILAPSGNEGVDSYTLALIRRTVYPPLPDWYHADHLIINCSMK